MRHGEASRTALGAAGHRAAHQALEGGAIFADPLGMSYVEPAKSGPLHLRLVYDGGGEVGETRVLLGLGLLLIGGLVLFNWRRDPQIR